MKKLKLQIQMTVDGFVSGPNGELDWMVWDWSDDIKKYMTALTDPVDCILMGRKMTEGFINYWSSVVKDPVNQEYEFGKIMYSTPKVVFTKTLNESDPIVAGWENTVLAKGDLDEEVHKLKEQEGGDIIVYGGSNFVSNLIRHNLIDEYYLFVNPVILGHGMAIFKNTEQKTDFKLIILSHLTVGLLCFVISPDKWKTPMLYFPGFI
jgi:dihydrofolate reductase